MKQPRKRFPFLPILLLLVLAGALFYGARAGFRALHPQILSLPAPIPGAALVIEGRNFGSGGTVLLNGQPVTPTAWTADRITLDLPTATQSGVVQVSRSLLGLELSSTETPFIVRLDAKPSQPYGYENPVQPGSPWPAFRRDLRNTGRSPLPANYPGGQPWSFQTGKGIFSTPIIDASGDIYIGSADHNFYALAPDGTELWRYPTGEIIDSAGILPAPDPQTGAVSVIFPSADGFLYRLNTASGIANVNDRVQWRFDARVSPRASFNNWFEGNVQIGMDGTLYAGNTNFNYYAIAPDGTLKWTYPTTSNNWSIAAIAPDGTIYWGSNDTYIRAVDPAGHEKWRTMTLGFIAASAAIGSDGTVYIGSFDSYLYALDPIDGHVRWKFKTNDHIYASAALGEDAAGQTNAIYFGSTDGTFYALDPQGSLLWTYDTGDPIRSSPVLGAKPDGENGEILYFGSGNGKLYALDAATGQRRWSYDTTPTDPTLRDRNDLNGSPALGVGGIVIGGETGQVWYLPYEYCLHAASDPRCQTAPTEDLPTQVTGLYYVTPGGSVEMADPTTLPVATTITQKLVVRQDGRTLDAHVCNNPLGCPKTALTVTITPTIDFEVQKSADGVYLYIRPRTFLDPNTQYTLTIDGTYYTGGLAIGNLTLGGKKAGSFHKETTFQTEGLQAIRPPLYMEKDRVTALEWTRLAVPIPPMMPSLNQIGFDYMDWIMGTVMIDPPCECGSGRFVLWVIGGKRGPDGTLVADPDTDFTFPLSGDYRGSSYILTNRSITIPVTGIPIPFNYFEMRGELQPDGSAAPGTTLYADTDALSIPTFGPYLVIAGLANNVYQKLIVSATYLVHPYPENGPANQRPQGVTVKSLTYTPPTGAADGEVVATLELAPGTSYRMAEHRPGILLMDEGIVEPVYINYLPNLSSTADANGNLATITLKIPAKTTMPTSLRAYVMLDVFPVYDQALGK